jgi:hypothetical protein
MKALWNKLDCRFPAFFWVKKANMIKTRLMGTYGFASPVFRSFFNRGRLSFGRLVDVKLGKCVQKSDHSAKAVLFLEF